jgi:hypothetical protein
MPLLHDSAVRTSIETRVNALRPDATRRWGKMTVDQMLWHVNQFLAATLGEVALPGQKSLIPAPLLRFIFIKMPWPKSAPTNPAGVAHGAYDFTAEQTRCLELIHRFTAQPIDGPWQVDPMLGNADGIFVSTLQAKHLDHHLRQFGV